MYHNLNPIHNEWAQNSHPANIYTICVCCLMFLGVYHGLLDYRKSMNCKPPLTKTTVCLLMISGKCPIRQNRFISVPIDWSYPLTASR